MNMSKSKQILQIIFRNRRHENCTIFSGKTSAVTSPNVKELKVHIILILSKGVQDFSKPVRNLQKLKPSKKVKLRSESLVTKPYIRKDVLIPDANGILRSITVIFKTKATSKVVQIKSRTQNLVNLLRNPLSID